MRVAKVVLFKPLAAGNPWLAVGISPVCCPGFVWFVGIVGIAPGLLLVFLRFVALGRGENCN